MIEQQKVQLTTFRPEASSGKRNERQYEKAHEFMKKKNVTEKYEEQLTAKCERYESDKTQQRKVRKWTIVGDRTEVKVEAVEGTSEARRKDDNGCTEVRNRLEVSALMQDEKY